MGISCQTDVASTLFLRHVRARMYAKGTCVPFRLKTTGFIRKRSKVTTESEIADLRVLD